MERLTADFPSDKLEKRKVAAEIGRLVRAIREHQGWSVHKFAKVLDSNMGMIHKLENGEKLPSVEQLKIIVAAFTGQYDWIDTMSDPEERERLEEFVQGLEKRVAEMMKEIDGVQQDTEDKG